jgi:predicted RNA-binding Zn-ribbon protein involved in translation (DUF1610 family)
MEFTLECTCGWEMSTREGSVTVECSDCGARYAVTVTTIQTPAGDVVE